VIPAVGRRYVQIGARAVATRGEVVISIVIALGRIADAGDLH